MTYYIKNIDQNFHYGSLEIYFTCHRRIILWPLAGYLSLLVIFLTENFIKIIIVNIYLY